MRRVRMIVLAVIFVILISAPLILSGLSAACETTLDVPLTGDVSSSQAPSFSFKAFADSGYQSGLNEYIHNNFMPRGVIIKYFNQMRYDLFKEGNCDIGRNGDLFFSGYLNEHCCCDNYDFSVPENDERMRAYAEKLATVSEKLAERGKCLIVFTAASKADYSEDEIPPKYFAMGNPDGITAGDCFDRYAEQYGLYYLDCEEYINSLDFGYPVFYKTGIHWSRPIDREIEIKLLEMMREKGYDVDELNVKDVISSDTPFDRDSDIFDLLNLTQKRPKETYYDYVVENIPSQTPVNILYQGDSFCEYLVRDLAFEGHNGIVTYIRYNQFLLTDYVLVNTFDGNYRSINIPKIVNDNDVFVIGAVKHDLLAYGYGFIDELYNYLIKPEEYGLKSVTELLGLVRNTDIDKAFNSGNAAPLTDVICEQLFGDNDRLSEYEFVERCYTAILGRDGSVNEIEAIEVNLKNGTYQRRDIIEIFVSSEEFNSRMLSE